MSSLPIDPATGRVPMQLDSTLGAVFIGTIIAGILWGVTCSQVFHYYTTRPKDSLWIKCMVAATWAFDTVHQTLIYIQLYQYCVSNFGNVVYLHSVPKTSPIDMAFIPLTALIVHTFYASKIWRLSGENKLMIAPVIVLCLAEFAIGIVRVYNSATSAMEWEAQLKADRMTGVIFSALSTSLDHVIAFGMVWLLRRNKSEYVQTQSIIGKLVVFVLSTSLLTAVCTMGIFIMYLALPKDLFVIPLFYILIRLYTNSFMAALNMRPYLRQSHRAAFEETIPATSGSAPVWKERITDDSATQKDSFNSKEAQASSIIPGTTAIELEEGVGKGLKDSKAAFNWN